MTWLHSQLRIYFQHGLKTSKISLVSNGFIRVGVPTQTTWRAGQHYFIRFLGLGTHAYTAHPFTACSLPTKANYYERTDSELVFYIRPQSGFTARLAKYAEKHPNGSMRVLLDGPYGGIEMPKLASCQKTLALAGGSGAGWLLPLIEAFLRRRDCLAAGCDPATGKMGAMCDGEGPEMRVILATRDIATRNWFEEAVSELLSQSLTGCCPSGLSVEIYYTGSESNAVAPKETGQFLQKPEETEKAPEAEIQNKISEASDSDSDRKSGSLLTPKDHSARPDLPSIIAAEAAEDASSMGVFCCGPLSMQSDVANAVAREQIKGIKNGKRDIYLHMEHFSWA